MLKLALLCISELKEKYFQRTMSLVPEVLPCEKEYLRHDSDSTSPDISSKSHKEQVTLPRETINATESIQSTSSANATTHKPVIIKTKNVTPMVNYEEMNSPQLIAELDKYGLKPLKRRRGIQLLKYIYESTHPFVEIPADKEEKTNEQVIKRRRLKDDERVEHSQVNSLVNIVGDLLLEK